jgi:DNA-binding NtrC family response regulator
MPATTPLRVLHIDKDKQFLEITQRILQLLGDFKVDTAQTISEANIALNQNNYDAIICAYYLGNINGLEYYNQLRSKYNPTPFILFTIDNETATKAQHTGVLFVTKYGDPEKVFTKLAELIKASKQ